MSPPAHPRLRFRDLFCLRGYHRLQDYVCVKCGYRHPKADSEKPSPEKRAARKRGRKKA